MKGHNAACGLLGCGGVARERGVFFGLRQHVGKDTTTIRTSENWYGHVVICDCHNFGRTVYPQWSQIGIGEFRRPNQKLMDASIFFPTTVCPM